MLSTFGPGRGADLSTRRSTGTGDRAATADSAASSPRSVSTAGWMPRARLRSSIERLLRLGVGLVEQLPRLVGVGGEPLAGHAEVHGEGDEPLLRAVVEVPLDAPAFGLGCVDDPRAARLEDRHPLVEGVAP